jgi:PPK2 family polyphosphate:nucleotide phosphotransferase
MKEYRIKPGSRFRLKDCNPDDRRFCPDKDKAKEETGKLLKRLDRLQERLYAEGRQSLLIVLQGMDTAGKDGVIRHVMSGVSPQGCQVASFKVPSREEQSHDFLWRIHQKVPPRGWIGIFNRSHYEDVLVTRVHGHVIKQEEERRYKEINRFEKMLVLNGTTIIKFFLHISKEEQRERLMDRAKDPQKRWKLSLSDLSERSYWRKYQKVYEETIAGTSTDYAPWYIVPANHKWYRNWVTASIIVDTLEEMHPRIPPPDPQIPFSRLKIR